MGWAVVVWGWGLQGTASATGVTDGLIRLFRSSRTVQLALETEAGIGLRAVFGVEAETAAHFGPALASRIAAAAARGTPAGARFLEESTQQLTRRLQLIDEAVIGFRAQVQAEKALAEMTRDVRKLRAIQAEEAFAEQFLIHHLSEKLLRVSDAVEATRALRVGDRNFLTRNRRLFLNHADDSVDRWVQSQSRQIGAGTMADLSAGTRLEAFWSRVRTEAAACRINRPERQRMSRRLGFWLRELGYDETVAAIGFFGAHGVFEARMSDFSVDFMTTFVSSVIGSGSLAVSDRLSVQWRAVMVGELAVENVLDAMLYYVSPQHRIMQQDTAEPDAEDALQRYGLSSVWTLGTSNPQVRFYDFLDQIDCAYGNSMKAKIGINVAQFSFAAGERFAYFLLRHNTIDQ